MVWQVVVPGIHSVTVVKARSTVPIPPGPASTTNGATLLTVLPPPVPLVLPLVPEPVPPQEDAATARIAAKVTPRSLRLVFTLFRPLSRYLAPFQECRHGQ